MKLVPCVVSDAYGDEELGTGEVKINEAEEVQYLLFAGRVISGAELADYNIAIRLENGRLYTL